jgi:hypothetical protein
MIRNYTILQMKECCGIGKNKRELAGTPRYASAKGSDMKRILLALTVFVIGFLCSLAGERPMTGTIVSETSVDCGTKKQGKKESTDILCQQYKVQSGSTEYQIRQPKPSNSSILPANTPIEFTINKNKMSFKVNGKKYEYLIVGTSAIGTPKN